MKFNIIETLEQGHQQIYQSEKLNNGDFDYRIYINIIDFSKAADFTGFGVSVCVAKTIDYITTEQQNNIANTFCLHVPEIEDAMIAEYGLMAYIDGEKTAVTTKQKAIKIANEFKKKADMYKTLFGFYLDKPQNRLGNTGWDFLDGKIGFN